MRVFAVNFDERIVVWDVVRRLWDIYQLGDVLLEEINGPHTSPIHKLLWQTVWGEYV